MQRPQLELELNNVTEVDCAAPGFSPNVAFWILLEMFHGFFHRNTAKEMEIFLISFLPGMLGKKLIFRV